MTLACKGKVIEVLKHKPGTFEYIEAKIRANEKTCLHIWYRIIFIWVWGVNGFSLLFLMVSQTLVLPQLFSSISNPLLKS